MCKRSSLTRQVKSFFSVGRLNDFYPEGAELSDSFSRIISSSHFARIKVLLDRTQGKIAFGGSTNAETKFIEPTLVTGVKGNDSLMTE
jgi:aldehyde dehydrogenase (NAD+)